MTARLWVLAACFLVTTAAVQRNSRPEIVPRRAAFADFPLQVARWQGQPTQPFDADVLRVLGVDDYVNRVYVSPDRRAVGLYAGFYKSQREGDTIHSPLNCLPGSGWQPVVEDRVSLDVGSGAPIRVNEFVIEKGLDRQVVIYWYQSHGRTVASEYWGRAYLAWDALRLNRTDGAMVRVVAPIDDRNPDGLAAARSTARDFVRAIFPLLPQYLPN